MRLHGLSPRLSVRGKTTSKARTLKECAFRTVLEPLLGSSPESRIHLWFLCLDNLVLQNAHLDLWVRQAIRSLNCKISP